MSVIFVLIGISVCLASIFLFAFLRASRSGQFEDTETPPMRMLFDDETKPPEENGTGKV